MKSQSVTPNDAELLQRVSQGDEKAVEILFKKYEERLRYFIIKEVHSKEDAEDIFLEAMEEVIKRARDGKIELFRSYLYKVSSNMIKRYRQKKKFERENVVSIHAVSPDDDRSFDPPDEETLTTFDVEELKTKQTALLAAWRTLSSLDRRILYDRYVHRLTSTEIGEKIGMAAVAVRQRIVQAKRKFVRGSSRALNKLLTILLLGTRIA